MGPKPKRRRNKLSEEEEIFNEKLESLLFKYRQDEIGVEAEGEEEKDLAITQAQNPVKGMFEDISNKIKISDIVNISNELEINWDETVLVILDEKEKISGFIEDDRGYQHNTAPNRDSNTLIILNRMKLSNIQVSARLKDSPSAIFKVNRLSLSEDEKSIILSTLNEVNGTNTRQCNFDNCFDQYSQYSDVTKGMDCPKYLKQLIHGYNLSILSIGVGESYVPGSKVGFLLDNLEALEGVLDQNTYRYDFTISYTIFGLTDSSCVNMINYKKYSSEEISVFLQDYELGMKDITDFNNTNLKEIKNFVMKGYSLPLLIFIKLRIESKNDLIESAVNVSTLCLGDLGSLTGNTNFERSLSQIRSIALTLDQTFVSGELKVKETAASHLLSPFIGGNANTICLIEFLTNASFSAVSDGFLFAESLRRVKNRIEQNFENYLVEEVGVLAERNEELERESRGLEAQIAALNSHLQSISIEKERLAADKEILSIENESQTFLLEYNAARMEVEQLEIKEKIKSLKIQLIQNDHEKAGKSCQAFEESIMRRQVEYELSKMTRFVHETEVKFTGQIASLKDRVSQTSEELERSVEERGIMHSKLQKYQHKIEQLNEQLREVEASRVQLELSVNAKRDQLSLQAQRDFENEIQTLRRQLQLARESERTLSMIEHRADEDRRGIVKFERELSALRSENNLLLAKLEAISSVNHHRVDSTTTASATATGVNRVRSVIDTIKTTTTGANTNSKLKVPLPSIGSTPMVRIPSINVPRKEVPFQIAESPDLTKISTRTGNKRKPLTNELNLKTEGSDPGSGIINEQLDQLVKSPTKRLSLVATASTTSNTIVESAEEIENKTITINASIEGGKKKIKLPERRPAAALGVAVPSTPAVITSGVEMTPLNKALDPSILSNFTVNLGKK